MRGRRETKCHEGQELYTAVSELRSVIVLCKV